MIGGISGLPLESVTSGVSYPPCVFYEPVTGVVKFSIFARHLRVSWAVKRVPEFRGYLLGRGAAPHCRGSILCNTHGAMTDELGGSDWNMRLDCRFEFCQEKGPCPKGRLAPGSYYI